MTDNIDLKIDLEYTVCLPSYNSVQGPIYYEDEEKNNKALNQTKFKFFSDLLHSSKSISLGKLSKWNSFILSFKSSNNWGSSGSPIFVLPQEESKD